MYVIYNFSLYQIVNEVIDFDILTSYQEQNPDMLIEIKNEESGVIEVRVSDVEDYSIYRNTSC